MQEFTIEQYKELESRVLAKVEKLYPEDTAGLGRDGTLLQASELHHYRRFYPDAPVEIGTVLPAHKQQPDRESWNPNRAAFYAPVSIGSGFYAGFDYSFWKNCRRAALASLLISPQIIRSAQQPDRESWNQTFLFCLLSRYSALAGACTEIIQEENGEFKGGSGFSTASRNASWLQPGSAFSMRSKQSAMRSSVSLISLVPLIPLYHLPSTPNPARPLPPLNSPFSSCIISVQAPL